VSDDSKINFSSLFFFNERKAHGTASGLRLRLTNSRPARRIANIHESCDKAMSNKAN
jgi:hypothetical protein